MLENTARDHRVMDLNKTVRIPDVGERTNNDPSYLMSSNDVLKLIKGTYPNGCDASGGKEVITQYLANEIIKEATTRYGWPEVKLIGKQLLFIK